MLEFLDGNNFFIPEPYDFRKGTSTQIAAADMIKYKVRLIIVGKQLHFSLTLPRNLILLTIQYY